MNPSLLRVLTGAAIIPAIILMDHLAGTFALAVILILLAIKEGRRFRALPNIILLVTVSAAHTLQPYGRYLFSILGHPITLGSLAIGAHKALLLISFIYLSHFIMASRPVIPGRLGSLLSLQFYYLDRLTVEWKNIPRTRPYLAVIDALLMRVSDQEGAHTPFERLKGSSCLGEADGPPVSLCSESCTASCCSGAPLAEALSASVSRMVNDSSLIEYSSEERRGLTGIHPLLLIDIESMESSYGVYQGEAFFL